jgi:hypothetical protein
MLIDEGTQEEIWRNTYNTHYRDNLIKRYGNYSTTFEHKIDYTMKIAHAEIIPDINIGGYKLMKAKSINNLKIMPMIKVVHSHSYSDRTDLDRYNRKASSLYVYPILRADMPVLPRTNLRVGFQGFPGLPQIYRNNYWPLTEEDETRMKIAFETTTTYPGNNIVVLSGVQRTTGRLINDRLTPDSGNTEYFITLQCE